jgi:hypothetical protein
VNGNLVCKLDITGGVVGEEKVKNTERYWPNRSSAARKLHHRLLAIDLSKTKVII